MTALYVVGKITNQTGAWELMGVFDDEDAARAVAEKAHHFVGPLTLNEVLPEAATAWPGAYYTSGT